MNEEKLGTHQKALDLNLDDSVYGTFAEIGAGQEVARWFFQVGGSSGTIAKTMSAYDMIFSDEIYGKCDRYVSRQRLQTMLDHEYRLLLERLARKRGADTRFFVLASTVAARSYSRKGESHGWMGLRFQSGPRDEPSDIIIHVRMLDQENLQQQEALGIIGVNLLYGGMRLSGDPEAFLLSLLDHLNRDRAEVDMIKFSGPDFASVDNRLMALKLVELGLAEAAMFTADGEVVQPAEILYKRPVLVERGSFRPFTNVTLDMLECARRQFLKEPLVQGEDVAVLLEITMRQLAGEAGVDHRDFLARVDIIGALGHTVLISSYVRYYRLASYLFRYTREMIGIAMGTPSLLEIFDEKHYTDLDGGILESFGRMFKNELKLYIYPFLDPKTNKLITSENLEVAPHLRHLHAHLIENHRIEPLTGANESFFPIYSREVLKMIVEGNTAWESLVPPQAAELIKTRGLFRN